MYVEHLVVSALVHICCYCVYVACGGGGWMMVRLEVAAFSHEDVAQAVSCG